MNKILVLNWKSNPATLDEVNSYSESLTELISKGKKYEKYEKLEKLVICPPEIFVSELSSGLEDELINAEQEEWLYKINIGIQNLAANNGGAFTGETTANMALSCGVEWAILGHSERRLNQKETNQIIAEKLTETAIKGLSPIVCVGYEDGAKNNYAKLVIDTKEEDGTQISVEINLAEMIEQVEIPFDTLIQNLKKGLEEKTYTAEELVEFLSQMTTLVAYEPVWAIGTGKTASPELIEEVFGYLSHSISKIEENFKKAFGSSPIISLIYGGSVNEKNIQDFGKIKNLAGYLVGGAGLKPDKVMAMIEAIISE